MIQAPHQVRLFPCTKLNRWSRSWHTQPSRPAASWPPPRSAEPHSGSQASSAAPWEALEEASWRQLSCGNLPATVVRALVAEQLQVSEQEAGARLQRLVQLLPGLPAQLNHSRRLDNLARLAGVEAAALTAAIVRLKAILPGTDVVGLLIVLPQLAATASDASMAALQHDVEALRGLLPSANIDSVFNANPLLLRDLGELTYGVQQIQRAAPQLEDGQVLELATNPAALFKVVHRKPQAQPSTAPMGQQQPG